jgi:pSer/pThr/pTyr-binding forkhead associated (FHA) protein
MKIRLQVKSASAAPVAWEYAGSQALVGRDPQCQLSFAHDDQASQVVSWQHAQIELSPQGAMLRDLGSTNGTFLDGSRLTAPARLSIGSEIRLGETGPRLSVVAIDLTPAAVTVAQPPRQPAAPALPVQAPVSVPSPAGGTRAVLMEMQKQHRQSLWVLGAIGVVVVIAGIAMVWFVGRSAREPDTSRAVARETIGPTSQVGADGAGVDPASNGGSAQATPVRNDLPPPPEETLVRKFEDAVGLVGVRIDRGLHITDVSCWACADKTLICPADILEDLNGRLNRSSQLDESLVICTPKATIAILSFRKGPEGFSAATLEASAAVTCRAAADNDSLPVPGQRLAVLSSASNMKDPKTIERKFSELTIERIQRGQDKAPTMLHAVGGKEWSPSAGSPVFDGAGRVVGCVGSAANGIVQIVPVSRLASLLEP